MLEWNKAFERIGFKDAIVVKQQPDDADFDTLDAGVASIRWMSTAQPVFGGYRPQPCRPAQRRDSRRRHRARKPRLAQPAQPARPRAGETGGAAAAQDSADLMQFGVQDRAAQALLGAPILATCRHGEHAAEQLGYAIDVLAARGEIDPDSPEARQFVLDHLKDVTMHEVGHTLGLRHNFRASHALSAEAGRRPGVHRREASPGR